MSHPNFKAQYPMSTALGLAPVSTSPGVELAGFDEDAVRAKLGDARYFALMAKVTNVFSCGHRLKNGVEAHAIYANDVESFLKAGG